MGKVQATPKEVADAEEGTCEVGSNGKFNCRAKGTPVKGANKEAPAEAPITTTVAARATPVKVAKNPAAKLMPEKPQAAKATPTKAPAAKAAATKAPVPAKGPNMIAKKPVGKASAPQK